MKASERLTAVTRLLDMRKYLDGVRREKRNQENWLAETMSFASKLRDLVAKEPDAELVCSTLTEHARQLTRRQLELEEAVRYRDLLVNEGAAATSEELDQAETRLKEARAKFMQLKEGHSRMIDKANILGRAGFPEVWKNISYNTRLAKFFHVLSLHVTSRFEFF